MVPCLSIIERSGTLCQAQYSFCEYVFNHAIRTVNMITEPRRQKGKKAKKADVSLYVIKINKLFRQKKHLGNIAQHLCNICATSVQHLCNTVHV